MATAANTPALDFADICEKIIDERIPINQLYPEIMHLKSLVLAVTQIELQPTLGSAEGETQTAHGLAISPSNAALCLDDYVRTICFIRGLYAAINDLLDEASPDIEVLYVGCGPFAILVLPLLKLLAKKPVYFTLIDIHPESVASVNSILKAWKLTPKIRFVLNQDALTYKPPNNYQADIIITEVMQAALKKEPQVAVSCHLKRLFPNAKMIPESVHVDLKWVNPEYEFNPKCSDKDAHRIDLGRLFTLDKKNINTWCVEHTMPENSKQLPSRCIQLPQDLCSEGQLMFFTQVHVYKKHSIQAYQSGLTCPLIACITGKIKPGRQIQFIYQMGDDPGLIGEVI